MMLSLSQAIREKRLDEFIEQAEASGIGPVATAKLDRALAKVITSPPEGDQASGSPRRDGSSGK